MRKKNNLFVGAALLITGLGVLPIAFCHGQPSATITRVGDVTKIISNNTGAVRDKSSVTIRKNDSMGHLITNIESGTQQIANDRGPNAGDYPASEQSRQNNTNGYNNNNATEYAANNNNYANNNASQTVRRCSPVAYQVGIKHYRYDEAAPQDLVTIGGRQVHRDAAPSLKQMIAAAKRDGVTLTVGSAFRSISYQQGIVNRKKAQHMPEKEIYSASAPAGYSEHSTGYAVDFSPIDNSFGRSKAYDWLKQHASQYGWEQSFTQTAAQQDHVMIEPWHWRFKASNTASNLFSSQKECP